LLANMQTPCTRKHPGCPYTPDHRKTGRRLARCGAHESHNRFISVKWQPVASRKPSFNRSMQISQDSQNQAEIATQGFTQQFSFDWISGQASRYHLMELLVDKNPKQTYDTWDERGAIITAPERRTAGWVGVGCPSSVPDCLIARLLPGPRTIDDSISLSLRS